MGENEGNAFIFHNNQVIQVQARARFLIIQEADASCKREGKTTKASKDRTLVHFPGFE